MAKMAPETTAIGKIQRGIPNQVAFFGYTPNGAEIWFRTDEFGNAYRAVKQPKLKGLVDTNRAMRNHNDGYSSSKELLHVGRVPIEFVEAWRQEAGGDQADAEDVAKVVRRKLNDSDFSAFRVTDKRA